MAASTGRCRSCRTYSAAPVLYAWLYSLISVLPWLKRKVVRSKADSFLCFAHSMSNIVQLDRVLATILAVNPSSGMAAVLP